MSALTNQPSDDPFAEILVQDLCASTGVFVAAYQTGIFRSPNPLDAFNRLVVESITDNKDREHVSEHELLSVKVKDRSTNKFHNFYIERTRSKSEPHPGVRASASRSVIGSLVSPSLTSGNSDSVAVETRESSGSNSEIELLPLIDESSEVLQAPLHTLNTPTSGLSRQTSLADVFSLSSVQILQSSLGSLDSVAEDRISGCGIFRMGLGRVVRQILPPKLSFYELAILVHAIHNEAPNYSLLKNQCYWFTRTICDIVELHYGNTLEDEGRDGKAPQEYLPHSAGHWNNFLVLASNEEEVRKIRDKFVKRKDQALSEVTNLKLQHRDDDMAAILKQRLQDLEEEVRELRLLKGTA